MDPWGQEPYAVRFDWGPAGAARASRCGGALVVVDVLSFTTAVSVMVDRGTRVIPGSAPDDGPLRGDGAAVATGRTQVTEDRPWSLSPAALRRAPAPERLVLPSPNGSAIAASAGPAEVVVAACLRNASAVAAWLGARPVTVVAAGERWPDGSLRPALEDLLGAGAVLAALAARGAGEASPEAAAARAAFEGTPDVAAAVRRCASGVELIGEGFAEDVEIAVELDESGSVPVLAGGAFGAP